MLSCEKCDFHRCEACAESGKKVSLNATPDTVSDILASMQREVSARWRRGCYAGYFLPWVFLAVSLLLVTACGLFRGIIAIVCMYFALFELISRFFHFPSAARRVRHGFAQASNIFITIAFVLPPVSVPMSSPLGAFGVFCCGVISVSLHRAHSMDPGYSPSRLLDEYGAVCEDLSRAAEASQGNDRHTPSIMLQSINDAESVPLLSQLQPSIKFIAEFCTSCLVHRSPRSFHCLTCGRCVPIHDHHCPWSDSCIGSRNTSSFFAFLVSCIFGIGSYLVAAVPFLAQEYASDKIPTRWVSLAWGRVFATVLQRAPPASVLITAIATLHISWIFHLLVEFIVTLSTDDTTRNSKQRGCLSVGCSNGLLVSNFVCRITGQPTREHRELLRGAAHKKK